MGDVIRADFGSDRWRRQTHEEACRCIDIVYGGDLQDADRNILASLVVSCLFTMVDPPAFQYHAPSSFPLPPLPASDSGAEFEIWKAAATKAIGAEIKKIGDEVARLARREALLHCASTFSAALPKIMASSSLVRSPNAERILGRE